MKSKGRAGRHWHAIHLVVAALVVAALVSACSSDGVGAALTNLVHGEQGGTADVREQTATAAAPSWCASGRQLDVIHLQFHSAGDELPPVEEVDAAIEAAAHISATVSDETLAGQAATLHEGLIDTRANGSTAIFAEEPYRSDATAVFDAIDAECG